LKASDGKKEFNLVYGGTGLDRDAGVRKLAIRTAKKVRKKAKKKRRKSSSSQGSTSMSSSTTTSEEVIDVELFEGQRESHRIWKKAPGALALATIAEAQPEPFNQARDSAGHSDGLLALFDGPVLPEQPSARYDSRAIQGIPSLGHDGGSPVERGGGQGLRLGLPKAEFIGELCQGSDAGHLPQLGAVATRANFPGDETQQAGRLTAEELKIQHKTRYLSPGKGGEASSHYTGGKKGKTKGDGKKGKGDHKGTRQGKEEDKEKSA
jgi:hypothetical protein